MKSVIQDYGLRTYAKELYPLNAAKRGGQTFKPYTKAFILRVKYAISQPAKVAALTFEKYPISIN